MIALEMKSTKNFMKTLLAPGPFDSFLLEEAVIKTYNTFHIDGHLVKEFYSSEELEELESNEKSTNFSLWADIHPFCFQLMKGKKTPVSFKIILHADSRISEKIAASPECGIAANLIRSLVLNIRYDNGKVTCITGCALTTFVMDKSVENVWDAFVRQLLSGNGLDFEEIS